MNLRKKFSHTTFANLRDVIVIDAVSGGFVETLTLRRLKTDFAPNADLTELFRGGKNETNKKFYEDILA